MFDRKQRLNNLKVELKKTGLDAILITNATNAAYLSGFKGSDSLIIITPDSQFFLTDSRYTEEAGDSIIGFTIVEVTTSIYDVVSKIAKGNGLRKIGFESLNLPYDAAKRLEDCIRPAKLIPVKNIVEILRVIKDAGEIERIKDSVHTAKDVLKTTLKSLRAGVSEQFLSDAIECEFIKNGVEKAFETIVACGRNCSKPHARPTCEVIAKNDSVMIDMGCRLNLYNSDITRMIFVGKVKNKIKEIYGIVGSAQSKAIEKIRPGRRISEIDSAGRDYIVKKGYGKFFGHSMGHGVGMDVHEEPSISKRNNGVLKPGMVFTIEPAIYLPKISGVRIEDMVLVTDKGCEVITK
ncbi:MAG: Xaa-Pro peptidase family protein [Candidatus Omnitrophota bacterium]|nr:Xaa-Pro peptidase family protein [Candidatus Omnitrophota bacterium]